MISDIINISRLMVHAKNVEESRAYSKSRGSKRARSFDGGPQREGLRYKIRLG